MAQKTLNLYFRSKGNSLIIGRLSADPEAELSELFFAYDPHWIDCGYPLGQDLPLAGRVFKTDRAHPYFGFLYDLIPGLGARKAAKRLFNRDLTPIELILAASDTLRPGAIAFGEDSQAPLQARNIGPVAMDLERLMMGHLNISDIDSLYRGLDALPGERFKLGYTTGKNLNVISKFNTPDPERNLVCWEAISLSLAKRAGLQTVSAELRSTRGMDTLVSTRFDRDADGNPLPFASARALLGAPYDSEHSYLEVADILNQEGARPKEDLKALWQRMVFNMAIGNTNDTLDNIGFIREREGWRLAPIYSLTPAPVAVSRRHHSTSVTDDCDRPDLEKAVEVASYFGLRRRFAEEESARIASFCAQQWEKIARDFQADPLQVDTMRKAFERLPY
ncbi:MAG TPA: type II toxin-antitoxin system HipA family toxin [Candidatus Aphodousia gallistercoris]|nr:type II toxin-antitoxin system HipA family toxin [Candidatus Aphodousia gallistercoris]